MDTHELNKKILKKFETYENLENIQLTDKWNDSFFQKLSEVQNNPYKPSSQLKYSFILILIIIINMTVAITILNDSKPPSGRNKGLQMVANSLLFSSIQSNN